MFKSIVSRILEIILNKYWKKKWIEKCLVYATNEKSRPDIEKKKKKRQCSKTTKRKQEGHDGPVSLTWVTVDSPKMWPRECKQVLLRLVTYFWTQSHPLSRQTFWYSFIKIEAKLWPLEGEQDFYSIWPSDPVFFNPTWPIFLTWPRYHQDKNSDRVSCKLNQNYGLKRVNMVLKQFDLLT